MIATQKTRAEHLGVIRLRPLPAVIVIAIGFATVDAGFLSANMMKVAQGRWVPLLPGALICCVMPI